jgi:hypothetical protein
VTVSGIGGKLQKRTAPKYGFMIRSPQEPSTATQPAIGSTAGPASTSGFGASSPALRGGLERDTPDYHVVGVPAGPTEKVKAV